MGIEVMVKFFILKLEINKFLINTQRIHFFVIFLHLSSSFFIFFNKNLRVKLNSR